MQPGRNGTTATLLGRASGGGRRGGGANGVVDVTGGDSSKSDCCLECLVAVRSGFGPVAYAIASALHLALAQRTEGWWLGVGRLAEVLARGRTVTGSC